jgi:hypothetical protein
MGQQLAPLGFGQAVGLQPLDHMELALLGHEGRAACKAFHAACRLAMLRGIPGVQACHQGHNDSQRHDHERPPGCPGSALTLPVLRLRVHEDRANDCGSLHWCRCFSLHQ